MPSRKVKEFRKKGWALSFLKKSMTFFGVGISDPEQSLYSWILFVIGVLVTIYFATSSISLAITEASLANSTTWIAWGLKNINYLVIVCYFRSRKKLVYDICSNVFKHQNSGKQSWLLFKLIVIWILTIISISCWLISHLNSYNWKKILESINSNLGVPYLVFSAAYFSASIGYELFLLMPESLLLLMYSTLCTDIAEMYNALRFEVENCGRVSKQFVTSITNRFEQLHRVVNSIDDVYSPILFFCNLDMILTLIFNVYLLTDKNDQTDLYYELMMLCRSFKVVFVFGDLCISASQIPNDARRAIHEMLERSHLYEDATLRELVYRKYVECVLEPPCLTAWKMFTVNRGLLLTHCSLAATYLVVMQQMK